MVSKKKVNHGFCGYRATPVPKAPRSIRKRGPRKDLVKEGNFCAFDLLAAVAGKLLQESESSASSNVAEGTLQLDIFRGESEKQNFVDDKTTKSESVDHGSSAESTFVPDVSTEQHNLLSGLGEQQQSEKISVLEQTSSLSSSYGVKKVDSDIKPGTCVVNKAVENPASIRVQNSFDCKLERGQEMHIEDEKSHPANTLTVKNPIKEFVNTNTLINSEDSVHLPLYSDPIPDAVVQKHLNNVDVGTRDDDENSSRCEKSSTKIRSFGPQPRTGHSRIRKMLTYKHRRSDHKLKDREVYNTYEDMKSFYKYRKRSYALGRMSAAQYARIKRRKLSDHSSAVVHDQDTSSDSISNFSKIGMGKATGSSATIRDAKEGKDHHVKFSIKSFRVPELCIEVPENTSFRSLKRAVMETVTSIFGSGFEVGVVLQGKKVRDDTKTLGEAGICDNSNLGSLGFTLEPNFTNVSSSLATKDLPSILPPDSDHALPRTPATPMIDSGNSDTQNDSLLASNFNGNVQECEIKSSPQTPTNEMTDGVSSPDSKAIVPVPAMNAEALAVVPVNKKLKRDEHSQRRIRRPFTVTEVEALVEAVEKLGTGRWRDVKMGAFEHADHRTYVDLKDKWKTLVHTASIAPQQRRGEPVPQELLDRVLAAHSYWSQNQSKLPGKQQQQQHSVPVEPLRTAVTRAPEMAQA